MPPGPYRLPRASRCGLLRRRGAGLVRWLHFHDEPVIARAWRGAGCVRIAADASTREAALYGIDRMRFVCGLDQDLSEFHARFGRDSLIGPVIRRWPAIRPERRAEPFEALAFAITEQLIEGGRAYEIQRSLIRRWGRRSACGEWRDAPTAEALAGCAPAELEACDLAPKRTLAMVRVAREVAAGRVDLGDHEPAWLRLRAIREIGSWTVEKLAFEGQGRDDMLPAGDLAYVKIVGRLAGLGRRATEHEVREFFEPYAPFQALAGTYAIAGRRALLRDAPPRWAAGRMPPPARRAA
ncbi:MAG: DNA-3-methyladenine glycosylase [Thermoleophilaceae bacterium]|nr:DNA-3-methyladenine glycosylase [Thermoleophilaceae bacterium]